MASRGTDRFSGKSVLRGIIYFHVIPCDFIVADGKWEEFVLQHYSEKQEFAAMKGCDRAHSAE
jgi:hypothetical protein